MSSDRSGDDVDPDDRVDQLETRLGDHDRELAALKKLAFGLADDDTDELFAAVEQALDRVETLETRLEELDQVGDMLADVAETTSTKEEKVGKIVTYAENTRRDEQPGVTVLPKSIKGVTEVSRRYAYDLVDDMIDEYAWAHDPAAVDRYGAVERDAPQKGVLIDFEGVHGAPCPVNKFTTRSAVEGVAD